MMDQIWWRNNKAAEKYNEEAVLHIFEDTLKWLKNDKTKRLKLEVFDYLAETHSIGTDTYYSWINNVHKDNVSIKKLNDAINRLLESRMIYEQEIRPNVQMAVLQNHFEYREKRQIETKDKELKTKTEELEDRIKQLEDK